MEPEHIVVVLGLHDALDGDHCDVALTLQLSVSQEGNGFKM